ncbi:MAG: TIGR04255 family protein [Planctomycetes bacterium]|nr:TIGR04255 family protein [Planctomycetota bacterium]
MARAKPRKTNRDLPDYKNPPVVEVVCGVSFDRLRKFLVHHVGLLWSQLAQDFTEIGEQPNLPRIFEGFDNEPRVNVELMQIQDWPRAQFAQPNGGDIIQVQRDRFLYNWRKRASEAYPRYEAVFGRFWAKLNQFSALMDQAQIGPVAPVQFELTYLNQILEGEGWTDWGQIGRMFVDAPSVKDGAKLLYSTHGINWLSTYDLPEKSGRLYAHLRSATRTLDKKPLLSLEMTVRGMPKDTSDATVKEWFDIAHKWIVQGFYELTSDKMQTGVWKRVNP